MMAAVLGLSGLTLGGLQVYAAHTKTASSLCPVANPLLAAQAGRVAIDESADGQNVSMANGSQLILIVKYDLSTGYGWSLREISNPAILAKVEAVYNSADI